MTLRPTQGDPTTKNIWGTLMNAWLDTFTNADSTAPGGTLKTAAVQAALGGSQPSVVAANPTGVAATDTAALQAWVAAINATGGNCYAQLGRGTYAVNAALGYITVSGVMIDACGIDATKFAYTGSGAGTVVLGINNVKDFDIRKAFTIDLSGSADTTCIGFHVKGAWFVDLGDLKVVQGPASSVGFLLETNNFGAYVIRLQGNDFTNGAGAAAVKTMQTGGDTRSVTHLDIYGGWSKGKTTGYYLDHASTCRLIGMSVDTATDGIFVSNSDNITLWPGELGGSVTGYGMNLGTGNNDINVILPSKVNEAGCALGLINETNCKPTKFTRDAWRVRASASDETYYAELKSIFTYASSLKLTVNGGGTATDALEYGDAAGTTLRGSSGSGKLVILDSHVKANGGVKKGLATLTYGPTPTYDCSKGDWQRCTVTNNTAFTINAPSNPPDATHTQEITYEFHNGSGGAITNVSGATWNAAHVLLGGALTDPANNKKRAIRFAWNSGNWIEVWRSTVDY